MKKYIGTKVIMAEPMTMTEAQKVLGRELKPATVEEDGYLVEYEGGYKSWSPKSVFEEAYRIAESPKDRLKIELSDIADKLIKLRHFLYVKECSVDDVGVCQYSLMVAQEHIMQSYKDILEKRLSLFENTCSENLSLEKEYAKKK